MMEGCGDAVLWCCGGRGMMEGVAVLWRERNDGGCCGVVAGEE